MCWFFSLSLHAWYNERLQGGTVHTSLGLQLGKFLSSDVGLYHLQAAGHLMAAQRTPYLHTKILNQSLI